MIPVICAMVFISTVMFSYRKINTLIVNTPQIPNILSKLISGLLSLILGGVAFYITVHYVSVFLLDLFGLALSMIQTS